MRLFNIVVAAVLILACPLEDENPSCEAWARRGECDVNPDYMLYSCSKSCAMAKEQKTVEKRPRVKQSQTVVANALSKFYECSSLASSQAESAGEAACASSCGRYTDCLSHCQNLSPHGLHSVLELCAPWQFMSNVSAAPGMNIMCVVPAPANCSKLLGLLVVFMNGRQAKRPLVFEVPTGIGTMSEFISQCDALVRKPVRGKLYQPSAFFTRMGERLLDLETLLQTPLVFMQEGGQWIWPGVRIGHEVKLIGLRNPEEVTIIRTASLVPAVFEVENFLRTEESHHIISLSKSRVHKSGVQLKDADIGKAAKEWRTSAQTFLSTNGDAILERVDARVQELTGIPITHAEPIQVLRYNHKEHYSAHHDFFDPEDYAKDRGTLQLIQHGATNRLATVFFYLTNVTRGGETNFPMAGGLPTPVDYFDCSRGFSSFPKSNKVIIFYSMFPSGEMDKYALHGGCDVLEGQKWSANFWLWNKPNAENEYHKERRITARRVGAVGSPGRREVEYSALARENARSEEL